jgi:cytoplasmic iron level regulating protein YaaA (DUF328/UPF0246 family)
MAYLITCAGSKQIPNILYPNTIDNLAYSNILLASRQQLIDLTGIQLDWDYTLPAWQLYSGERSKLYPRVHANNWNKPCVEVKILSALFGWINHTDKIPFYDLKMTSTINLNNSKKSIWRYWRDTTLLNGIVNQQTDIDLLSMNYRKAINGNVQNVAQIHSVHFNDYGVQKGNWLNNELTNLMC